MRRRRPRSPRLIAVRAGVALTVLAFLVAQPTGASSKTASFVMSETSTATSAATEPPTTTTAPPTTIPSTTTAAPAPVVTAAPTTEAAAPRPTIPHFSSSAEPVALTFDDGPNENFTPQVLDILARYGVHATFFVVGGEVDRLPDLTRRIVAEGHVLGNHTWDHLDLTTLDDEGFRGQIDRTDELLTSIGGHRPACVRPPYGRVNQWVRDQLSSRGLVMSRWSTDTDDWNRPGVEAIVRRALGGAKPGAVILLHDSGPDMSQTVDALPRIIEGMRARGLRIAPSCAG